MYDRPALPASRTGKFSIPLIAGAVAAVLVLGGIIAFAASRGSSYDRAMSEGVDHLQHGRAEAARVAFSTAVRERPEEAEPHVFLARLARNEGDVNTARRELDAAIRSEPKLGIAQREMGLLLLAQGDPELARKFFVRAIESDSKDLAAQGYLGCALLKLGRPQDAENFFRRAGNGAWSSCQVPLTQATMPSPYP